MKTSNSRILTDIYREALTKCNILEEAIPAYGNNGLISNTKVYNKAKRLLDCPKMEPAHPYLYNLNFLDIGDEDSAKVDSLYDLAIAEGYITEDDEAEEYSADDDQTADSDDTDEVDTVADNPADPIVATSVSKFIPKDKDFICFYSAFKDNIVRTGECYVTGLTPDEAKVAAKSSLTKLGFSDINILAIEEAEEDVTVNSLVKAIDFTSAEAQPTTDDDQNTQEEPIEAESKTGIVEAEEDEPAEEPVEEPAEPAEEPVEDTSSDEEPTEEPAEEEAPAEEETTEEPAEDASSDEEPAEEQPEEPSDDSTDAEQTDEESAEEPSDDQPDASGDETEDTEVEPNPDNKSVSDKTDDIINPEDDSINLDPDKTISSDNIKNTDEISYAEKIDLFAAYFKIFKNALKQLNAKSYNTMSLSDKSKFWNILATAWDSSKPDPMDFMTAANIENLENYTLSDETASKESDDV